MKVLHINSFGKGGGAETVFNITSKIQVDDIKNYSGFVLDIDSSDDIDINFSNWENNNKLLGIINYIFSFKNYKILKEFLEKYQIDIIHIHGFFSSLSPSILLAIKKYKKRKPLQVIQTLHDFHLICPNSSLFNFNKNKICEKCIGKNYKWLILKDNCDRRGRGFSIIKGVRSFVSNNILNHKLIVDQFIVPSNFLKLKLIEDGIGDNKITLIRNPIDFNITKTQKTKKNIICYFGRFSSEKNLSFLINAFSTWKEKNKNDFKLLLIGKGEKESELKNIAQTNHFGEDIIFKSFLPKEQLIDEIKNAKYFTLTSKCYENFPMTIIESIALNIIPIVPNIGGMEESVNNYLKIGMVYEEGSIESWIKKMDLLESNYQDYFDNLIDKKNNVLSQLNVDRYYSNITNIYKKLLNPTN